MCKILKEGEMDPKSLNFQSQNVFVDHISFKFQYLSSSPTIKIANYVFEVVFYFCKQSGKLSKPNRKCIMVTCENTLEVLFLLRCLIGTLVFFNFLDRMLKVFTVSLKMNQFLENFCLM